MQGTDAIVELYAPVRTFLAYIATHLSTTTAADSSPSARPRSPIIDVPWEAWGPHGVHVVQAEDQTYIICRVHAG
jgi:hypothetical protein